MSLYQAARHSKIEVGQVLDGGSLREEWRGLGESRAEDIRDIHSAEKRETAVRQATCIVRKNTLAYGGTKGNSPGYEHKSSGDASGSEEELFAAWIIRLLSALRLLLENISGISLGVLHDIRHGNLVQEPISEFMAKNIREGQRDEQKRLRKAHFCAQLI